MTDPTLTITISRTELGLDPLVFSGADDGEVLGVVAYTEPALQRRVAYAPDSVDVDGSEAVAASWQQSMLNFDWVRDGDATEAQVQASRNEVRDAVGQFAYTVTTQVNGAPVEVWAADGGSQTPSPRDYLNLAYRNPVYAVSIPVYPIPGSA